MFHDIPQAVLDRMRYLEAVDARDRRDNTPKLQRLRQIPPETGKFLALLAASAPPGEVVEIGTSGGYSSLWLALACRKRGDRLTTFEILEEKARLAEETIRLAGAQEHIRLVHGDALALLPEYGRIAFCFLDAEKELYTPFFELIAPRLVSGGFLAADNAISHADELQEFLELARADARFDSLVVPIGKGVLVCRKS